MGVSRDKVSINQVGYVLNCYELHERSPTETHVAPSIIEPRHEKTGFLHGSRTADQRLSFRYTATRIVQSLVLLNPKFQASSHMQ